MYKKGWCRNVTSHFSSLLTTKNIIGCWNLSMKLERLLVSALSFSLSHPCLYKFAITTGLDSSHAKPVIYHTERKTRHFLSKTVGTIWHINKIKHPRSNTWIKVKRETWTIKLRLPRTKRVFSELT